MYENIYSMNISRDQLIIGCIVALFIFLYSLELTSFSGYTFLGLIVLGMVLYFGVYEYLFSGKSLISIIIMIIIGLIILSFIYGGYMLYENNQKFKKNWPKYRCKPYVMPFAGWLGPGNVSVTDNFTNCMWSINKTFFDILISPFTDVLKTITSILSGMVNDIQNIRKMIAYMRSSMEDMAKDILLKIWNSYTRIANLFKIILRLFEKLGTVFKDVFEILLYVFYTMASLWNGPIGGVANFFCFDRKTLINMNDGNKKRIENIKLYECLEKYNSVIGILKFSAKDVDMYDYHGIIVSGNHLAKEDKKMIKVKDSLCSKKIDNYGEDIIYCLITSQNLIRIGDLEFADYNEVSNKKFIQRIHNLTLKNLNKSNEIKYDEYFPLESGLGENIEIKIMNENNEFVNKKIKDIQVGDQTEYGKVLGVIQIDSRHKKFTNKIYKYDGKIMSGNILIYQNNQWIPLYQLSDAEQIKNNKYRKKLYHIITENGIINIGKDFIRDFDQNRDEDFNEKLEYIIMNHLNKS